MCNSKGRKLFLLVFDSAFKLFQLCVAPWVANVVCVNLEELDCECVNARWHLFMHRVVTIIILKGFCSWGMFQFAQPVHADKHFQVCSINLKTLHPIFHLAPVAQKVDITIKWINVY